MARDLKLNIDGSSTDAQRALEEAAAASEVAAKAANHLGDEFRKAARDAGELDKKLLETKVAAAALAKEFSKTNDSGIKKELEAQRSAASELQKLRKDIVQDTEKDAKAAEQAWSKAEANVAKAAKKVAEEAKKVAEDAKNQPGLFSGLGGAVEGGLTSPLGLGLAGVGAGPALAAAGGGLAALAGAGIAGAGVAGAVLGNPKAFQDAWGIALRSVKKDFFDSTQLFTGPTLTAIRSIGPTVASWHIGSTFADAAKYVEPLVSGVEGFATGVVRGVSALSDKAAPAIGVLSTGLDKLGTAAGDALSSIADGAEGGAEALHDTIAAVALLVEGFGKVTEAAENAYGFVQSHPIVAGIATGGLTAGASILSNALGNADEQTGHFTQTALGAKEAAEKAGHAFDVEGDDLTALATKLATTKATTDTFAGSMSDKIFNSLLAADHATLGWHESLTNLSAALKENHRDLDIATEKGQANREAILGVVQANIQQYDTNIAAGQTAGQAAAAYDANTAALEKQLRAAHFTQAQIDDLIGTYAKVPDSVNTNIAIQGLTNAINDLDDTLALLNHIDGYTAHAKVVVDQEYIGNRASTYSQQVPHFNAKGSIRHAAGGMIVPPRDPGTLIVGEPPTQGEAWIPLGGISSSRAMGLAQTVGNNYGFDAVPRGGVPRGLFGSRSSGSSGPTQLIYNGPTTGLDAIFATWLAKQTRVGNIRIHSNAIVD